MVDKKVVDIVIHQRKQREQYVVHKELRNRNVYQYGAESVETQGVMALLWIAEILEQIEEGLNG